MMRLCTKCSALKPCAEFGQRQSRAKGDGPAPTLWQSHCLQCVRVESRARQEVIRARPGESEARRAKAKLRTPEYRQRLEATAAANRGKVYRTKAEQQRQASHLAMCKAAMRRMRQEIARGQGQRAKDALINAKPWRGPSLSKAEQFAMRYRMDPEFALTQRVRAGLKRQRQGIKLGDLIRMAIKRDGSSPKVASFIGYTVAQLRQHLEALFTEGMDWPAFCRGEIHIDHIRPMASFDLSDIEQIKAAWRMDNLQPLWAADNLAKGAKWAA